MAIDDVFHTDFLFGIVFQGAQKSELELDEPSLLQFRE